MQFGPGWAFDQLANLALAEPDLAEGTDDMLGNSHANEGESATTSSSNSAPGILVGSALASDAQVPFLSQRN